MWPYWLMFLVPASAALLERPLPVYGRSPANAARWSIPTLCVVLAITLLIGYRYEVGGDWGAYERQIEDLQWVPLTTALTMPDPGYSSLNVISAQLGWGIFGVNLVCGAIFAIGLMRLCRSLPRPWLALTVAVPYLLIVVAMGYSRQGAALGFAMLGLVDLQRRSPLKFVIWVLIGATFHKTAVLVLPIAALAHSRHRVWSIAIALGTTYLGYLVLLQDSFDAMYVNYVEANMASEGALIRLLMNAVPALLLIVFRKRLPLTKAERSLWTWFALITLGLLGALFVTSASTAIDRAALYLLPLQLMVFSHLPNLIRAKPGKASTARFLNAVIVVYYGIALFVWLNFATYSTYWLPYQFYPFKWV